MKRTKILTWVAFAASLLIGITTLASAAQEPNPEGEAARHVRRGMHAMNVEEHLRQMTEKLNLTAEQQEKIKPILQSQADQMKSLHQDKSLSPDQRREKAQEIRKSCRKQIAGILTPEQKAQWREGARERRERRHAAPGK